MLFIDKISCILFLCRHYNHKHNLNTTLWIISTQYQLLCMIDVKFHSNYLIKHHHPLYLSILQRSKIINLFSFNSHHLSSSTLLSSLVTSQFQGFASFPLYSVHFTLSNLSHHKKEQRNTYKYNCDSFDVSVSLIHPTHFPHFQHKIPTFLYISPFSQPFRTFPWLFFSFSKPPYPIILFLQFHWLMFFICLLISLLFLFFMNRLIFHCYFSLFLLPFSPFSF